MSRFVEEEENPDICFDLSKTGLNLIELKDVFIKVQMFLYRRMYF